YTSPEIAVIMNSVHASFKNPQLWECEGIVIKDDYGLKCGCRSITTIRRIPLPEISVEQTIRFAIGVASLVCSNESWRRWAVDWLTGKDRTAEAAEARARATAWAAAAAAAAAAARAAGAAAAAARAARAAEAWAEAAAEAAAGAAAAAAAEASAWAAASRAWDAF